MDSLEHFSMSLSSYLSLRIHPIFFILPGINFRGFLYSGLFVNPCTKNVLFRHLHISSPAQTTTPGGLRQCRTEISAHSESTSLLKTSLPIMLALVNISSGLTNHHGPDRLESSTKWPTLPESRQLLLRSPYSLLTLLRVDFVILRCKSQWQDFATQMWVSRNDIFHWPGAGQALMYLSYACLWSQQFYPCHSSCLPTTLTGNWETKTTVLFLIHDH